MNEKNIRVSQLFRKPKEFFSIERVFGQLRPELDKVVTVERWIAPRAGISLQSILRNIWRANSQKADVYHVTGDIHYVVLGLPRRHTLLTIHDCVFLYQASGYKRRLLKWLLLDWPVRYCKLVTTISESTRRDIIAHTGCAPEKVVVIPDPVDAGIGYSVRAFREEEPVILFIGTTPNKNLPRVIQALEGISCRLDIVGPIPADAAALLQKHRISYSNGVGLSDQEMADKYAGADLILFPSTFEGFGLPIIEAQKAGRPVVTSDLDPMKEVAGEAGNLVDPHSIVSIREGVLRVIADKDYREQLVSSGLRNIERFNTEQIASQYVSCYRRLSSRKQP